MRCRFAVSPWVAHRNGFTEANNVVEAQPTKLLVALLIAKAPVRQHADAHPRRHALRELLQKPVLMRVALAFELRLIDRLPQQRCRTAMVGDQVRRDRRMSVLVEFGPVQRHHDFRPWADDESDPGACKSPYRHVLVAQETIDLLDRVFRILVSSPRHRTADHVDA